MFSTYTFFRSTRTATKTHKNVLLQDLKVFNTTWKNLLLQKPTVGVCLKEEILHRKPGKPVQEILYHEEQNCLGSASLKATSSPDIFKVDILKRMLFRFSPPFPQNLTKLTLVLNYFKNYITKCNVLTVVLKGKALSKSSSKSES